MQNPAPFAFAPSQLWHGNDGNWSSFDVRVGNPEQNFRVLPSAAIGDLIVPHAVGCSTDDGDLPDCALLRGVSDTNKLPGFTPNLSTTWQQEGDGYFQMRLDHNLGYDDSALYGRDTVGLLLQHSGGPTLQNRTVGAVRQMPFFVGYFGLAPLATNFTNFNEPQPSYLTTLKNNLTIPSLSYAYNAGAYYSKSTQALLKTMLIVIESPKVFGSLTLGGYDEARFEPNNFTFTFNPDETQPTSLKLQRIAAERTFNGSAVLLQDETYVNIDFTMPYLWLPGDVCDNIASLFRLRYDNLTELYLVDDAIHADLLTRSPTFTFSFGSSSDDSQLLNIELPYAAFNLQASWPIYNDTKNYFPIRRAANETQFTLGRAFMQEAYMIVDFERGNFSLHQATFPPSNVQKIVAIAAKDAQTDNEKDGLSKGSIAGIATGSFIFAALLILLTTLLIRRHKLQRGKPGVSKSKELSGSEKKPGTSELAEEGAEKKQLVGKEVLEMSSSNDAEIDGKARYELA